MSTIHWGIIGCGDVTEVKSGPGFQKATGSALVAVMRRNGSLAADYAKRHNVPRWYDNADALIADPEVDAVYVATPPGSHLELTLKVAAARKPCYVEKPMARSHVECLRVIEAFERAGVPLFVAYYRRALPRFVKAKELIESGALGHVTACRYRMLRIAPKDTSAWRYDAAQAGGGLFLDIGSHVLDVLDFILGEFVEFGGAASGSRAGSVEENVAVHFRTARGAVGSTQWSFNAPRNEELLEIEGPAGRISMEVLGHTPVKLETSGQTQEFSLPDPPHIEQPLIQAVVDELLGRGRSPSTGTSAARTSKVMDAALSRYYAGRDDEFWLRANSWNASD